MKPGMDRREHRGALLNQRLRRPNRCIGLDVSNLLLARRHDPLGGVRQPRQQAK